MFANVFESYHVIQSLPIYLQIYIKICKKLAQAFSEILIPYLSIYISIWSSVFGHPPPPYCFSTPLLTLEGEAQLLGDERMSSGYKLVSTGCMWQMKEIRYRYKFIIN